MRQKQADPGPRQADSFPVDGGGSSWSFRHWRVPTRLTAIVLVPVLTGLTFAGLRVKDQLDLATAASQNEKIAVLVRDSSTVVDDLENERDLAVAPQLAGIQNDPKVAAARQKTNADIVTMNADAKSVKSDDRISTELGTFNTAANKPVGGLGDLRGNGNSRTKNPIDTQQGYSSLFFPLMGLDNELTFGNNNVNSRGRELYALSLAKASTSTERNLMTIALVSDKMPAALGMGVQVANKLTSTSLGQFLLAGIPSDLALYNKTVIGQNLDPAELTLIGLMNKPSLKPSGVTFDSWFQLATTRIDQQRTVEQAITDQIVADAHKAQSDATQQAISVAAEALALILFAGVLAYLMGRSMVRGMRTLRDSAQDIASVRLPDLVQKLSKTDPERVDTTVKPIPLTGRDEIGEVARAFDDVHREAIRLASEQALLRGNVNAIFTNLSRRSQGLIERQLGLITDLENNEADPDQLESLFKLDHLATRMRRNGENLLVLAGESAGREWSDPIPLVDVLRAAASEVEQYERIELSGIPETDVIGPAVTDMVHLLAELLENATTFSSPQTRVRVTATRLPDQRVLVEIHDKGIGLTAEDFAEINSKLAEPPTVDASVSRQMGLFVVGRLAERHGIRVQLRPSGESAGTTSLVMVPDHLTQLPRAAEPEEQFTVSRIYGEDPKAFAVPDTRTASEYGFDDSRYERQSQAGSTANGVPAPRPLRPGQRRDQAALESAPQAAPQSPTQPPSQGVPQGFGADGYQDYGNAFAPEFGGPQQADRYPGQYGAPAPEPASASAGYDDFGDFPAPSYPAPDATYEAGRYTAADFESAGAQDPFARDPFRAEEPYAAQGYQANEQYGHEQYGPQDPYQPEPQYGHPYYSENAHTAPAPAPETPMAPPPSASRLPSSPPALPQRPSPAPAATANGSLPTRRPGQALGGRAIGDREVGERPNWFTGAREEEDEQTPSLSSAASFAPPAAAEPSTGGTTPAGLPRRVPRQNLLPGNVQEPSTASQATAPQLSRSPEEVRGRLTNLRRGIQQGHSAGDTPSPDQHGGADLFGGPNHPER
ncbi:signal transduction histidine kinase [Streptacidiphilus sp. MAP12-16]|uniref:sensor histidine kinase n=1 Tax=Streptacidiphilus sp. MAP12-16 TaxID=3156300 RepID=UPI003514B8EC